MRAIQIIGLGLLLVGLVGCQRQSMEPQPRPISKIAQPIVNGKIDFRYPAVGALTFLGRPFCTGTLIRPDVVLTAAHCTDFARAGLYAFLRADWRDFKFRIDLPVEGKEGEFTSQVFDVAPESIRHHPNWVPYFGRYSYDIAVFALLKKVPSTVATPIPFNKDSLLKGDVGKEALFMGYGVTKTVPLSASAVTKSSTTIPITNITDQELTFGPNKIESSVCFGDSGGPALLEYNGEFRVIAVNSHLAQSTYLPGSGGANASCDGSSNSVRTDAHLGFLQQFLREYGDTSIACARSADCGFCATCNDQDQCTPRDDLNKLEKTCQPCSKDGDCGAGVCRLSTNGYRCFQPCLLERCCPDGYFCEPITPGSLSKLCRPKTLSCPDVTCQNDSECGRAGSCVQGVCKRKLPERSASLCRPCKSNDDCGGANQLCFRNGDSGLCLQACSKDSLCPDGFQCRVYYAGFPKQCGPSRGLDCKLSCTKDADCADGWTCNDSVCQQQSKAKENEACSDSIPCDDNLVCVRTSLGERCLMPCGQERGLPGSPCDTEGGCADKATCSTNSRSTSVCLNTCKTKEDCTASGGGTCYMGYCMCDRDDECLDGKVCNKTTQLMGACAPKRPDVECPSGRTCLKFAAGAYCSQPSNPGRSAGDSCDAMTPCATGLRCFETEGGPICVEDCTQSGQCKHGGSCRDFRGTKLCVCSNQSCNIGRTCIPVLFRSNGFCKMTDETICSLPSDCPPGLDCIEQKCQVKPKPEPVQEVTVPEELPTPEEAVAPEEPVVVTKDAGSTQETTTTLETAPPQACGCEQQEPTPILLLILFLAAGLLGVRKKRKLPISR